MPKILNQGQGVVHSRDGAGIFYRTLGEGTRTVLFLHGWGGSGSGPFWNRMLRRLPTDGLRLVLVDLRGHGRSEPTRAGFTTEQFADDMFAVADRLGAEELVLVAFSMSGRWAQWMSCTRPERVIGQVLIAPVPAVALPLTEAMCDGWIESVRTRTAFESFARQFTRNALPPDVLDDYFSDASGTPEHSLRETFRMCCQPGFTESLAATRAATLILGGTFDPLFTPDSLKQEVLNHIPGARMSLLDCGHELPLEEPAKTAEAIQAFLAGI